MKSLSWDVAIAVLGVAVPVLVLLWEFVFIGRRRLGYRVEMDTTATNEYARLSAGDWYQLLGRLNNPSFVLLRIENPGSADIDERHYAVLSGQRAGVGVRVRFPERRVIAMAVTELSGGLGPLNFTEELGLGGQDVYDQAMGKVHGEIDLPKVPLNRGAYYKVMAVLEGTANDGGGPKEFAPPEVLGGIKGGLVGGGIERTKIRTGTPRQAIALIAFLMAVVLAQLAVSRGTGTLAAAIGAALTASAVGVLLAAAPSWWWRRGKTTSGNDAPPGRLGVILQLASTGAVILAFGVLIWFITAASSLPQDISDITTAVASFIAAVAAWTSALAARRTAKRTAQESESNPDQGRPPGTAHDRRTRRKRFGSVLRHAARGDNGGAEKNAHAEPAKESAVSEKVGRAVDLLASDGIDKRREGIEVLEGLVHAGPAESEVAMRTLAAFIREYPYLTAAADKVPADVQEALTFVASEGHHGSAGARLDLRDAFLVRVYLAAAHLPHARLNGARLANSRLRDADLTGADLWGADLSGADLTGARLDGADLTEADLTGTRLDGVRWTAETRWPDSEDVRIRRISLETRAHVFRVRDTDSSG